MLLFELWAELTTFLVVISPEEMIDRYLMVIQTRVFGRHFLENQRNKPVTSRKTTDSTCCQ